MVLGWFSELQEGRLESGHELAVLCADVGSVAQGRFGWAEVDPVGYPDHTSERMEELAEAVASHLAQGRKVALGFECPLTVPLRSDPSTLGKAREGEGNRSWSAGAGAGALATGLVQVPWVLRDIRARLTSPVPAYLGWEAFRESSGAALFVWEAFVTGSAKAEGVENSHAQDAVIANRAFRLALPDIAAANAVTVSEAFSLVGAALLRSGWTGDESVLEESAVVIRPAPNLMRFVGDLFAKKPLQWGLRGDVPMWAELEKTHQATPMPSTKAQLAELLLREFERVVGVPLGVEEMTHVPRFDVGGMSSGFVSHEAWRDRFIPMLVDRIQRPSL